MKKVRSRSSPVDLVTLRRPGMYPNNDYSKEPDPKNYKFYSMDFDKKAVSSNQQFEWLDETGQ